MSLFDWKKLREYSVNHWMEWMEKKHYLQEKHSRLIINV